LSYIEQVLLPDEIVLSWTHLHWFIYLRSIALLGLALVLLVASTAVAQTVELYFQIAALVVALIGVWFLIFAWLRRRSTELAVTNRRVIHKTGVLGRTTHEMSRDKVETVEVQQSLIGRIFNYGTIIVRGTGSSWEPFSHIENPLVFRSNITAA
jgi:uncharacterized membrane protein YdbT with pleckstrin-like domain